ncbi:PAS domain-containing hybrid sensor histidine kinase/response regulator [Enterovirga aerilata]|uniref:histidine kinase n=1 Tax=Enterovirga aerilata TaxID=2730920 RepID=A0A849HTK5_9HYPH|nr:PAS domain-containing hybrid sensor histidine kinase/response regulator [Enterovirga sp. DB1703]NNM70826.1 hybrid sensor histidine kinase/response regulator [Enterovirga sp. DB1703]
MIASWAVFLSALVYLCLLFAVAHWGDHSGRRVMRRRWGPTVYALALAVYCTSWTFYGSVGLASRAGLNFLAIYIGPILLICLGCPLIARVIRIAKAQNITSVADFVAARYGKSERVAALVCIIAVIGALPYIALQLKAVSASVEVLLAAETREATGTPLLGDIALLVAILLAGFSVAFGTRHADATEHQNGMVLAIALESLVKLGAFLLVGFFVVYWMFDGFTDMVARLGKSGYALDLLGPTADPISYAAMLLISASAALLLPRQFHMMVVENRGPEDLRRAVWLFPLYLVAINVFVVPLALAGLHLFPGQGVDRDMTVLLLPLHGGSGTVALITFIGGLSAATAMVIVETIAVSVMIANHLVMPLVLRRRGFSGEALPGAEAPNLGRFLLLVRRISIVALTLLAYAYYRLAGDAELAAIGLLSFAAVAQIAPAFLGGLFWRRATAQGATAGLVVGIVTWAYTLLLPTMIDDPASSVLLAEGPFGLAGLRPTAIAGLDLPQLTHGIVWSLALNLIAYIGFSLARPANALERLQAAAFMGENRMPIAPTMRLLRASVSVDELSRAVGRFLGEDRTRRSFAGFARSRGMVLDQQAEADIHFLRYAEHLLASAIGAASSRLALSLVLRRGNLSTRAALRLLDEASAALQHDRDLLQHAIDHAQQGITVLDKDLRLLTWNQAFIDLYGFPPELIRIGVGMEEIIRVNAERGAYGPGNVDDLVAMRLHSVMHDPGPVRVKLYPSGRVISVRSNRLPGGGLVNTYTDVTDLFAQEQERERENETLEQRVRERTEELTRLNEELTRAKKLADEANASKTRFLAAASHDILQPLNAARLYATSLAERTTDPEERSLAENVDASLDAVEEILTTLLDISRLDTGALRPQWSTVKLDELFRQLAREFGPLAEAKNLKLTFMRTGLAVRADRQLLRRLLQNLVSNAVKYTPNGRVLVGVRRSGAQARIEVWDTGMGIPASQQKTIFREFRRLSAGAKAARGLGLGLSIVERIAKTLGAEIGLKSEPDRGSVFSVTLPAVRAEPSSAPEPPATARRPQIAPLQRMVVLAIDNEPAVLDGMARLLKGWGCEVVTATSIEEARGRVHAAGEPEIVIADYHLDDGEGLSAIAAVREEIGFDLPAVLVTADRSPELRERAAEQDVSILNKPLKPAALRALLSRVHVARVAAE